MSLHPWGATLDTKGLRVVTDIDPVNLWLSSVRAGQAGSLHQGQGSDCDGDDGVHLWKCGFIEDLELWKHMMYN